MKTSTKFLLAGLTAATLGAATLPAFAMPPGCDGMGGGMMSQGGPWDGANTRFAEQSEKRQAALHKKLNLSAEQETAWKAYTEKMQAISQSVSARPEPGDMRLLSTPERLEKMQAMMKEHEKYMEGRIAAIKAFYDVLTPEQRKVFDAMPMGPGRRR